MYGITLDFVLMSVSLVVASGVGQCSPISMFVFGFRILKVGGGESGTTVHGESVWRLWRKKRWIWKQAWKW